MDMIILYSVCIIIVILLIIFIRKKNLIEAQISFLFMQVPTWLFGSLVVKGGLIEYPVGLLSVVYKASFTFEFFVFPSISAIFNVHFPKGKPWYYKTGYILIFPAVMTLIEVYLEKNTELIKYLNWTWYMSFISITLTLLLSYWYYLWFFSKVTKA
ncbi:CBO0543 family protein [Paenibacillus sp. MMO-177]|uniref:CBO0543 family protein n=1 Tax=Paenibacillus sp. MMO-177 TaxID=3081289 RepID=UPI003017EC4B